MSRWTWPSVCAASSFLVATLSAASASSTPLFLTLEDLDTYPFAGMVAPCLTPNRTDPKLPQQADPISSCAVVGSSPSMLGTSTGSAIDSHAAVFRVGMCTPQEIVPCEKHIGQKIDFCVSFANRFLNERDRNTVARQVIPMKSWNWLIDVGPRLRQQNWHKCEGKFLLTHPDFISHIEAQVSDDLAQTQLPERAPVAWRNISHFSDPGCLARHGLEDSSEKDADLSKVCGRIIDFSSTLYAVKLAMELCNKVHVYAVRIGSGDGKPKQRTYAFPLEDHLLRLWNSTGRIHLHPSSDVHTDRRLSEHHDEHESNEACLKAISSDLGKGDGRSASRA